MTEATPYDVTVAVTIFMWVIFVIFMATRKEAHDE